MSRICLQCLLHIYLFIFYECLYSLLGMLWTLKKNKIKVSKLLLFAKEHVIHGDCQPLLTCLPCLMQWLTSLVHDFHQGRVIGMERCLQRTSKILKGLCVMQLCTYAHTLHDVFIYTPL